MILPRGRHQIRCPPPFKLHDIIKISLKEQLTTISLKTSLVVPWLQPHTPNAGGPGSIPGQGTRSRMPQVKILHATTKNPACHNQDPAQPNQSILKKKKKKQPTKSQPANKGWQSQHPIPPSAPVLQCHWAHRHTVGSP